MYFFKTTYQNFYRKPRQFIKIVQYVIFMYKNNGKCNVCVSNKKILNKYKLSMVFFVSRLLYGTIQIWLESNKCLELCRVGIQYYEWLEQFASNKSQNQCLNKCQVQFSITYTVTL